MPNEIAEALGSGQTALQASVARWMPAGIARCEVGEVYDPQDGLPMRTMTMTGPFGEQVTVLAILSGRDPRPICDEVPLVKIGGGAFGGRCCDLVAWCFADTGRAVTLPMEAVIRFMIASDERLSFMGRLETGVSQWQAHYERWDRIWMAMIDLRAALVPHLCWRGHIEAPEGIAFCRLPGCDQMARYPGPPKKSVWCWRHYEMSRGDLPMKHETDRGNRARSKKEPSFPKADAPPDEDLMREAEDPDLEMTAW